MTTAAEIVDRATERLPAHSRNGGPPPARGRGRYPVLVVAVAFVVGVAVAKLIDWRSHAHPRD